MCVCRIGEYATLSGSEFMRFMTSFYHKLSGSDCKDSFWISNKQNTGYCVAGIVEMLLGSIQSDLIQKKKGVLGKSVATFLLSHSWKIMRAICSMQGKTVPCRLTDFEALHLCYVPPSLILETAGGLFSWAQIQTLHSPPNTLSQSMNGPAAPPVVFICNIGGPYHLRWSMCYIDILCFVEDEDFSRISHVCTIYNRFTTTYELNDESHPITVTHQNFWFSVQSLFRCLQLVDNWDQAVICDTFIYTWAIYYYY